MRKSRKNEFRVKHSHPPCGRSWQGYKFPYRRGELQNMPYIAYNYLNNPAAPQENWVCSPESGLGPYKSPDKPPIDSRAYPNYCGQCVSFAKTVCPTLPPTKAWKQGAAVIGNTDIKPGTVIAAFDENAKYNGNNGHTAIFHAATNDAIIVYDQWITGNGKAIGRRPLRVGSKGRSNDPAGFSVVE